MTLQSIEFLTWLLISVAVFWRLKPAHQLPFLAAATLIFLLLKAPASALMLLAIALATFGLSRDGDAGLRLLLAALAAAFFAYKAGLAWAPAGFPTELTLLGFSFYVLRAVHYALEKAKGTLPNHPLSDFLCYMFFFPTLLVGPINRFPEFLRESRRRRWDPAMVSSGLERLLFGYAKIVVLGNYVTTLKLGQFVERIEVGHPALAAYLSCLQYGLNLYFQFSGYSDVAIGFALLLGIRLSENFHFPFLKTNISDFWKSWHISLSSWCRDYIHTPVIAWTRKPLLAVFCSMFALGLWHEFSPRYVLWGAYHGAGLMAWQVFQGWKHGRPAPTHRYQRLAAQGVAWFLTFNFVVLSFAITKETDLAATLAVYRRMLLP